MDLELKGKVAIVTGGSKGIGKEIARQLAAEGASVAICARTEETLKAAAKELAKETGSRVLPFVANVSSKDSVDRMVEAVVESFGRLDILVNNAGQPGGKATGPLATVTDEDMLSDLDTKLVGYLRCVRAAAPHMVRHSWGRIVHVGGNSARLPGTYSTGTRNIAVVHLSRTLAEELGPSGITSNVVHPSITRTEYFANVLATRAKKEGRSPQEIEQEYARNHSLKRVVDATEVASVVVFLASARASAVTGQVLEAGGGATRAVLS